MYTKQNVMFLNCLSRLRISVQERQLCKNAVTANKKIYTHQL